MKPVQITPKASSDIEKLAQGVDRAQVALEALKESELTPNQVQELEALLKNVSARSATTSPAVSEIRLVDNHKAVVGKITVNGQQLDTLLSEGSFNKLPAAQIAYAKELGYRMAYRAEHLAYAEDLLEKEGKGTINDAEKNALKTYREGLVRDAQGGLDVHRRRLRADHFIWDDDVALANRGALFVRASAESN
jgi:hypothetical protein